MAQCISFLSGHFCLKPIENIYEANFHYYVFFDFRLSIWLKRHLQNFSKVKKKWFRQCSLVFLMRPKYFMTKKLIRKLKFSWLYILESCVVSEKMLLIFMGIASGNGTHTFTTGKTAFLTWVQLPLSLKHWLVHPCCLSSSGS